MKLSFYHINDYIYFHWVNIRKLAFGSHSLDSSQEGLLGSYVVFLIDMSPASIITISDKLQKHSLLAKIIIF